VAAIGGLPLARATGAFASSPNPMGHHLAPAAALQRLLDGNARFVAGRLNGSAGIAGQRMKVASGQEPFAVVLTCSDSRVAPEYVFDEGLGDLFVARVAGNVLDGDVLGSIEYAVAHFQSSVVVVLGHQRCGAVTESVELVHRHETAPGAIQGIVNEIRPAIAATKRGSLDEKEYVEAVIRTNAKLVAHAMPRRSTIVATAVRTGKLRVVPARYSLDTGRVALIP
jgi:carbonic anhydrase